MCEKQFDVNKLRVAAPCPMNWDAMKGDDRKRFCDSCKLNVFNVAELTEREVRALVAKSKQERVCVKLYRRADGTVVTRDCPVGLRAIRRRAASFAGAALATVLSLFSVSYSQTGKDKDFPQISQEQITRTITANQENVVRGVVIDSNGAVVPDVKITLRNEENGKKITLKTDSDGFFETASLKAGRYKIKAFSKPFQIYGGAFTVNKNEIIKLEIQLQVNPVTVVVGIFAEEPLIDVTSSGTTHRITREMIERLPH